LHISFKSVRENTEPLNVTRSGINRDFNLILLECRTYE
jgi:hypothetical protein